MRKEFDEQRLVPRFPLPKEKIKFLFDGFEKIFAVRDISLNGIGVSLLEYGESVLFPPGFSCAAELKLGDDSPFKITLRVARTSAWSVGFTYDGLNPPQQDRIRALIDPLQIATTLRLVDARVAPEAFGAGISAWYHGDPGTDLYLWNGRRSDLSRVLFCHGESFWEWRDTDGVTTGRIEQLEGEKVLLHRDATPDPKVRRLARKVLEHADVLDYRLVSFLKDRI